MEFQALQERTRQLSVNLNKLQGSYESMEHREQELIQTVGLAKGRLDRREEIGSFLDTLQSRAHERNVGSYERMLTSLVSDILPGEGSIGLDLSTERGLPALDIYVDKEEGRREDILDGNGGALTNVICLGLRAIATAKARKRMFMALDEADCWIEPGRIENFYSVIKQMASSIGLQCLFIAHHDISRFSEGIAVARLLDDGSGKPVVEHDPMAPKWESADQAGIRFIRLVNFMSHEDTLLKLSPGMNALLGQNNLGKSVIMRALRAAAYGEVADTDIRHGEKRLEAHFGLEGGRNLVFSREKKRNPVNLWELVDQDGNVIEENGKRYETGGRNVPDWVEDVLQMPVMDGLDIHISHQKRPVFLLGDQPSKRASVLSVGQESGHIQSMIAKHKEWCTNDNATVRNGEKEVAHIRASMEAMTPILEQREQLTAIESSLSAMQAATSKTQALEKTITRLESLKGRVERLEGATESLSDLPKELPPLTDLAALDRLINAIEDRSAARDRHTDILTSLQSLPPHMVHVDDTAQVTAVLRRLEKAQAAHTRISNICTVLADIPVQLPEAKPLDHILAAGTKLRIAGDKHAAATTSLEKAEADRVAIEKQLADELAKIDNLCPTCHQPTDVHHILHAAE